MEKPFSFFLVTDTHYFDSSFGRTGPAYEERSRTDQNVLPKHLPLLTQALKQIAEDTQTDVILIPGDLVYRGEYRVMLGSVRKALSAQRTGKKIYLITARHDYGGESAEFIDDKVVPVKGMPREELRDFL